jgi:hypothetical protein
MLRPARFSLPNGIATDGERFSARASNLRSRRARFRFLVRATVQRAAAANQPRIVGPLALARRTNRRTGQDRRLSWGMFPFSVFQRRCADPGVPHSGQSRFDVSRIVGGRSV